MNVKDIESPKNEEIEGDRLELIFEKQHSLAQKYNQIEISQGVGYGILGDKKFNLNEIRSQCLLKDMAWRVTEEICEANECVHVVTRVVQNRDHFLEELADALHFLTELCLTAGVGPWDIAMDVYVDGVHKDLWASLFNEPDFDRSNNPFNTILHLGLAMNCLKQKPWKQTHIMTDGKKFKVHLIDAYRAFGKYLACHSDPEEMYDYYFRKNKVNQFRQKSHY